jgi:hypothetical protein
MPVGYWVFEEIRYSLEFGRNLGWQYRLNVLKGTNK